MNQVYADMGRNCCSNLGVRRIWVGGCFETEDNHMSCLHIMIELADWNIPIPREIAWMACIIIGRET